MMTYLFNFLIVKAGEVLKVSPTRPTHPTGFATNCYRSIYNFLKSNITVVRVG